MAVFVSDIPKHMRLFELIRQEQVAEIAARPVSIEGGRPASDSLTTLQTQATQSLRRR